MYMPKSYTTHDALIGRIESTYEQWDKGHSTIAIGSAAILLHLHDVGIDASTSNALMDVPDVDALANEAFVSKLHYDINTNQYPTGFTYELFGPNNSAVTGYETDGIRILDSATSSFLLPFEAFPKYDDSKHGINFDAARRTANLRDNGQLIMPMREIVTWKLSVGRARDLAYCAALLKVLQSNEYLLPESQGELETLLASKTLTLPTPQL